jgi:GTP pyrophosphokinase
MTDFNNIKELAQSYLHDVDLEPLEKAYKFAENIHADQVHPTSGELYFTHLLSVTEILLSMKLDLQTVISGLLHGVLKTYLPGRECKKIAVGNGVRCKGFACQAC